MLVFIFVFPTQQDLWRHNNPSEPWERRGRHKHVYVSESGRRAWILADVYVWGVRGDKAGSVLLKHAPLGVFLPSVTRVGAPAPAAPLQIEGDRCVSSCSETHDAPPHTPLRLKCCLFFSFYSLKRVLRDFFFLCFFFPDGFWDYQWDSASRSGVYLK